MLPKEERIPKVADQVWIGTALLTREQPGRRSFRPREILDRVAKERFAELVPPGVQVNISQHAVANLPPNPGRYRMLVATPDRERRLFRDGDSYHPGREGGKTTPKREEIPQKYWELLDWYEKDYNSTSVIADDGDRLTVTSEVGALLQLIDGTVDQLVAEVSIGSFGKYWTEAEIAASHWWTLRTALAGRGDLEVHLELPISGERARPDVSIITAPPDPWSDRRGAGAIYAAEIKSFAYRGSTRYYRLADVWFSSLLEEGGSSLQAEFDRLADMVRQGLLEGGLLLWRDSFDWREIASEVERREVIEERRQWVINRLYAPGVRVEYVPVLFPPSTSVGRLRT